MKKKNRECDSDSREQMLQSSNCNFGILNIYSIFLH